VDADTIVTWKFGKTSKTTQGSVANRVQILESKAMALYFLGMYERSNDIYDTILVMEPSNGVAYNSKGMNFLELRQFASALPCFLNAVRYLDTIEYTANMRSPAYRNVGICYEELKQFDSALVYVDRSIRLDSTIPMQYIIRGGILLKMGMIDSARFCYRNLFNAISVPHSIQNEFEKAWNVMLKADYVKANAMFKKIVIENDDSNAANAGSIGDFSQSVAWSAAYVMDWIYDKSGGKVERRM
jgi:tetratricopeptide (TPR) repeat protein